MEINIHTKQNPYHQPQGPYDAELLEMSSIFVEKLKALEVSKHWQVKDEKPLLVYEQEAEGRLIVKATITVNIPYQKVLQFFSNPAFMKILNDNVDLFEVLYDNKIIRVIHVIMKLPGPISNRQICAVNTVRIEGNKAYVGNRSCNYPFNKDPDTVLAFAHVAGFILEKIEAGRTSVTHIADMDVKGSIPQFVMNAMASKRVQSLLILQQKIKQHV